MRKVKAPDYGKLDDLLFPSLGEYVSNRRRVTSRVVDLPCGHSGLRGTYWSKLTSTVRRWEENCGGEKFFTDTD